MRTLKATNVLPMLLACLSLSLLGTIEAQPIAETNLWQLAKEHSRVYRYSTLFTAQDVRHYLSSEAGVQAAIEWCKRCGITKVYLEEFRDGYKAEKTTLLNAAAGFRAAGFEVSGCVTTTKVGKPSTGWKEVASCYTDEGTQARLQSIFKYAASLFDEIMIDDFWFTDCTCPECDAARRAQIVTIGRHTYPVRGDTWADYRCELMVRLSQACLLGAARQINPRVRLIIKYPQWYDNFQNRGYEVLRETADFDRIWVGTETRDYQDPRWGGTPQFEGYFIMRWLGGIGGTKTGGGWFDWLGTTAQTYVEQARQTVLGGAPESMLFCYGGLQHDTGPEDITALRANIPELLSVATEVRSRAIVGLAAYKPANSSPGDEARVFDFLGMLGFPLVPCHAFPADAPAAFFSIHALKDEALVPKLRKFIKTGKPLLLTDGLATALTNRLDLKAPNVLILRVRGQPKSLLNLRPGEVDQLRSVALKPFGASFHAPNRVALYLFRDRSWVVENFNDSPISAELDGRALTVPGRGWQCHWQSHKD